MPATKEQLAEVAARRKASNDAYVAQKAGKPAPVAAPVATKSSDETRSVLGKIRDAISEILPDGSKPAILDPKTKRQPMHGGKSYDDIVDAASAVDAGIADGNAENKR